VIDRKPAVAYLRGTSRRIASERAAIKAWAERQGCEVTEWFLSGSADGDPDRRQPFKAAIAAAGRGGTLVVAWPGVLSQKYLDRALAMIAAAGVQLVSTIDEERGPTSHLDPAPSQRDRWGNPPPGSRAG